LKTGVVSGVVMIIIGTSNIFGLIVAFEQLALKIEALMKPMGLYFFIFSVNILFLILGAIMDFGPSMLIMCPILAPIAVNLGIDPIHFGVVVIVNLVIGLITPPLGQVLFVVSPIGEISFESVTKEVLPFLIAMIAILLILSYFPFFSLYIPRILGFI
jgi:TRAP-type C4-dicarboxylate transport system permease large subunit